MAGSRLEKIGSIFARTYGLLESKAMKVEDKPIWYDVYAIHSPDKEPRFDREAPNTRIRDIFYEEDVIRARFHETRRMGSYKLTDTRRKTRTQEFIDIYNNLKAQGPLDEEKIFEVAMEQLESNKPEESSRDDSITLVDDFKQAMERDQQKMPKISFKVADAYGLPK